MGAGFTIVVDELSNSFEAVIDFNPALVGCGSSIGEAVRDVLWRHGPAVGFDVGRVAFEERSDGIMAFLDGNRTLWGCGKTSEAAFLQVIVTHGDCIGATVRLPPPATRAQSRP